LIPGLMICLLNSCTPNTFYPGFYTPGISPRIIQPIPQNGNENALPQNANFVQSYSKYKKSKTNSTFGALVRVIEFEYDIKDNFTIIPRITSGYDEGEMTGLLTILIDQYELTYENKATQVREYVETVSYESSRSDQSSRSTNTNVIVTPEGSHSNMTSPGSVSTLHNGIQEKDMQVLNRSQLYNSANYIVEDEDVKLLLKSKTLSFVIHLQNTNLTIFPTKEQIRILKKMINKHY
jgi:hypothetical protein